MLIRANEEVLGDTRWHPLLDVIASLLERDGNTHFFDPLELGNLLESPWLRGASGDRSLIAETIKASAKTISRKAFSDAVVLEIDGRADEAGETSKNTIRIHPFGALFILSQPLQIIVEDETSDGGFVLWVARALGIDAFRVAYNSGALTFRHAGGKGQLSKSAVSLSWGVWPRSTKPIRSMRLRAVAILDSDAKHQHHTPNREIRDAVEPHVAFIHVLAKRTIENYVPARFLRERIGAGGRARIDAFLRLTHLQRSFFPLKVGYRGQAGVGMSLQEFAASAQTMPEEVTLFRGVPPEDWALICEGFGEGISAVFTNARYRCEPNDTKLFDRTDVEELGVLLRRILRHL